MFHSFEPTIQKQRMCLLFQYMPQCVDIETLPVLLVHYNEVIMSAMASKITGLTIVYSRRRSKKTSKLRVTGLCEGNSPVTGEFPTQRASNAENVFICWRHHAMDSSPKRPLIRSFRVFAMLNVLVFNSVALTWTQPWFLTPCRNRRHSLRNLITQWNSFYPNDKHMVELWSHVPAAHIRLNLERNFPREIGPT